MNLTSWLKYLETFPSGVNNNSLDNIKKVAHKLNLLNFYKKYSGKIIIVGGTNGKGSCVVSLESILLAAGYRTGAFISPHLLRYNERIRLNGADIDNRNLIQAFRQVEQARADIILSYFEFSALAALAIFKKQNIDILILEVGLGGRFDSVNILDADIAIITTVSCDHTSILGDTREAIGYEKAGIMRAFKPVICGDVNIPKSVSNFANKTKAILYSAPCLKSLKNNSITANTPTVLMTIKLLQQDFKISKIAINAGLKKAFLPGRLQRITIANKEIILDVAHNPEAATLLAQNLAEIKCKSKGHILAVMSMLSDKDITATLKTMAKIIDKWYLGALTDIRATCTAQLAQCLLKAGGSNFIIFSTIAKALQQAIAECGEKDRIVMFGSFRTIADGLEVITNLLEIKK